MTGNTGDTGGDRRYRGLQGIQGVTGDTGDTGSNGGYMGCHGILYRGSKSPALAGDLPLYSSFLSYLPLSRFSLASSRYDDNRRGHAHFAGARRRSSGLAAL